MIATETRAQGSRDAMRPPITHAEDPSQLGIALCGAKLRGKPASPGSERCIVCRDLVRRTFVGR